MRKVPQEHQRTVFIRVGFLSILSNSEISEALDHLPTAYYQMIGKNWLLYVTNWFILRKL